MFEVVTAMFISCLAPTAVDGDTVRCDKNPVTVRIFGVNAPERGKPGYAESKAHLQAIIQGGLVCNPKGTSYGRVVAMCYNGNLIDVGLLQLANSHVVEWCAYSKNQYGTCQ